jgi:hypothetical protein
MGALVVNITFGDGVVGYEGTLVRTEGVSIEEGIMGSG